MIEDMKSIKKVSCWLISFILLLTLSACKQPMEEPDNIVTKTSYQILSSTIYETTVYVFASNLPGPTVMIVGGIHGDEVAGWQAAQELITKDNDTGIVIIIPKANYLATVLQKRYPGQENKGVYDGITYSDLNRIFPGKIDGSVTEQIAYALIQEVEKYQPDYIVDLHESRRSYADKSSPLIGDEVIYGNSKSTFFAYDMVDLFNKEYLELEDIRFAVDNSAPVGSFNNYCGNNYEAIVLTIETNRQLDLSKRIEQQLTLIEILFKLAKEDNH
jgi:predicted deacylase